MAQDPSKDLFELFQKFWNPLSVPVPDLLKPTLDVNEIEKKVTELRAVENWLKLNLNIVGMSIQTLETQKAALQGLRDATKPR